MAWRVRSLVSASVVMAGATGAVVGATFLSSLYLQQVLGTSALVARPGVPPAGGVHHSQRRCHLPRATHLGVKRLIVIGLVIAAAGALVLASIDGDPSYLTDVPAMTHTSRSRSAPCWCPPSSPRMPR